MRVARNNSNNNMIVVPGVLTKMTMMYFCLGIVVVPMPMTVTIIAKGKFSKWFRS